MSANAYQHVLQFHMILMYHKLIMILSAHSLNQDLEKILTFKSEMKTNFINANFILFFINFSSTFSRVVISFKNEVFIPSKRSELNSITDFFANSGGLFGLFLGASVLSFFEIIYYFTLRIIFSRRKEHKIQQIQHGNQSGTFVFLP